MLAYIQVYAKVIKADELVVPCLDLPLLKLAGAPDLFFS